MTRLDEFICPTCGRSFGRSSKLSDHMNSHTGARPYSCSTCPKTYSRSDHLKRHILLAHTVAPAGIRHECSICKKIFSLKHQLKRHVKTHKACGDKKDGAILGCEMCSEGFSKNSSLLKHLWTAHQVPYQHKCPSCPDKSFLSERQLRKHQKRHERIYSCENCETILPNWSSLIEHRRLQHSKSHQRPDQPLKIFRCGECQKVLSSKSALLVHHKTVHLREKPFRCAQCQCSFGHKHLLTRHSRTCTMPIM